MNRLQKVNDAVSVKLTQVYYKFRDSVVSIATRCGLDGTGIDPGGGRDITNLSIPALEPTQSG